MNSERDSDFDSYCLQPGLRLHVRRSRRFKSVWIDLFLPRLLRPLEATRMALIGRLLERGTARLPGIRELNCYMDHLYGASFSCQTVALGPFQVLHLHYDAVDGAYLPGRVDLLAPGFELLGEALCEPHLVSESFPEQWVAQEKQALRRSVDAMYSDRTMLAQRRCLEIMCAGEPYGLAAHGDPRDLDLLDGPGLLSGLRQLTSTAPLDVYVCGDVDTDRVLELARRTLGWPRNSVEEAPVPPFHTGNGSVRTVGESAAVAQGRMMLGYRTDVTVGGTGTARYPALALFNLLLGGDVHSRLYQHVREEAGLCYHIASYTEPMGGMLFVEAGVEAHDRRSVSELVAGQLRQLAREGPEAGELELSRALAFQRLDGFDDARESLVRFDYYRRLAGADNSRHRFRQALGEVSPDAVRSVAESIELDTDYFLSPS